MIDIELSEMGYLILSALVEPTHGYEIMKVIGTELEGILSVGPATLYTTLAKLEKAGLCEYEEVSNKKIYTITPSGLNVLKTEAEKKYRVLQFLKNQIEKGASK